jgi:signal transduction protein with GAF and PtsI domain
VALSSDAPSDSRFKHIQHLIEDTYQAMLSVPLVSGGNVIGIVNVHQQAARVHVRREAYLRMRDQSRRLQRSMKELAEAIILADELGRG